MPTYSLSIAKKIRNRFAENNYKGAYFAATRSFLPLDEESINEIIDGLSLSEQEKPKGENLEYLAVSINCFAEETYNRTYEDRAFEDAFMLMKILAMIEHPRAQCTEETCTKIKKFLALFPDGKTAEQFLTIFYTTPGLEVKDALPQTSYLQEALAQLNLIVANVNFDILIDTFMREESVPSNHNSFVLGGVNSTEQIRQLEKVNDQSISSIEAKMRPGKYSMLGFIGENESLIDVLVSDNEYVVDTMHLTHQLLSAPLRAMIYICKKNESLRSDIEFTLHDNTFKFSYRRSKGWQDSPFDDQLTGGDELTIENITNGKKLNFTDLGVLLIERYGFYQGKTKWRIEPRNILEVLDCLFPKPQLVSSRSPKQRLV